MKIVGFDLHTRYQQIAMLDQETGELVERRLEHATARRGPSMPHWSRQCWWESKPPGTRAGLSACWPS
jgi:hypothetical protein